MLRILRTRAWSAAVAAMLVLGTTGAAFERLLHAVPAQHDVACAGLESTHDASSHRFVATPEETGSDTHCLACHAGRALRLGAHAAAGTHRLDEAATPRPIASIGTPRSSALTSVPGRSPPPAA